MHLNFKMYNAPGSYETKTMPILKKNGSFRNFQKIHSSTQQMKKQCLFEILKVTAFHRNITW